MKPEVMRPRRRIPWRRAIAGVAIAWSSWCASRVLEDHAGAGQRGPVCTTTVYYDEAPLPAWSAS